MSWRVEVGRDAKKELRGCQHPCRSAWPEAILSLEVDPFPSGCKKLRNRDGWRLRLGIIEFSISPISRRDESTSA